MPSPLQRRPTSVKAIKAESPHKLIPLNVQLTDRRTSMRLEAGFWDGLHEICTRTNRTLTQVLDAIDAGKSGSLASAVRVYVAEYFRKGAGRRAAA